MSSFCLLWQNPCSHSLCSLKAFYLLSAQCVKVCEDILCCSLYSTMWPMENGEFSIQSGHWASLALRRMYSHFNRCSYNTVLPVFFFCSNHYYNFSYSSWEWAKPLPPSHPHCWSAKFQSKQKKSQEFLFLWGCWVGLCVTGIYSFTTMWSAEQTWRVDLKPLTKWSVLHIHVPSLYQFAVPEISTWDRHKCSAQP